jgi:hypothetical protein
MMNPTNTITNLAIQQVEDLLERMRKAHPMRDQDVNAPVIETVDFDQDLTIQYATIQQNLLDCVKEDELRRVRGVITNKTTGEIVHPGSFFPYEFTDKEQCEKKMNELNHKLEDMTVQYSYEGTIIRIFYYKRWYICTHRKLDSGKSKWGSNDSFKFLFEKGLKESYGIVLQDLINKLNLRCQYTFMIMANENTRFVCVPNHFPKKVYFVASNDPDLMLNIDLLPKPEQMFETLDSVFDYAKHMTYPFTHQGLLLIHQNGSQYRIVSSEYARLFQVRNNEQSIPYRYLQLKSQNDYTSIDLLKKLFPQYIKTFDSYDNYVQQLASIIYNEYSLRKQRSKLPANLTTVQQIDQKLYLFIKNNLFGHPFDSITNNKILELLWLEEPSNLNHMIRMVKYEERKKERASRIEEEEKTTTTPTTTVLTTSLKKKRVKYTRRIPIPIEYTCRKRLIV